MTKEAFVIKRFFGVCGIIYILVYAYGFICLNYVNYPRLSPYVNEILLSLNSDQIKYISGLKEDEILGRLYLGFGTYIRNKYFYSKEYSDLKYYMYVHGIFSEESMSSLMLHLIWIKLKNQNGI